jgi:type I restriction enzyme R subunit
MKSASPNFRFLAAHDPLLARLPTLAELYAVDDPNTALFKLRQFGEALLRQVAAAAGVRPGQAGDGTQHSLIQALRGDGILPSDVADRFHLLRRVGNDAVHEFGGSTGDVLHHLKVARELGVWFHRTFADPGFRPGAFVAPTPALDPAAALREQVEQLRAEVDEERRRVEAAGLAAELESELRREAEHLAASASEERETALAMATEVEALLAAERARMAAELEAARLAAARLPTERLEEVRERARRAAGMMALDEGGTRAQLIDQQLREAGWEADSERLRWSAGTRPERGRNLAIAEWPIGQTGRADYVLFAGLTAVGVVEAKRAGVQVAGSIEQAKRYSRGYEVRAGERLAGGPWDGFRVPFLFATNGRAYLEQIAEQSGIWFLDARSPTHQARALQGWYSPEGLLELLAQDVGSAEAALRAMPTDALPLRDYQRSAVEAVEAALARGERSVLVAMATGTGKTRTVIGLVYRLLKARRFRRVLFLVDRTALGEQAQDQLQNVRLEQHQSLADIYDVKELGDLRPEGDTRVHVATVQGMLRRVLFAEGGEALPVDTYDCVVVDECHRGYSLDRELGDTELLFRDQADYVSKYRRLVEYFDAVKIGLTATPALHTTQIFGEPVFRYSYREAVVDGYLVDHELPTRIVTALAEDGITWRVGETVQVYDARRAQVDAFQTPDEIHLEVEEFNRRVVSESFNRVVCRELARHIDPEQPGKTLVFCVNDEHADRVVRLLNEAFAHAYGEVHNDAVQKITGKAHQPSSLLRRYKTERLPSVAVTVDLLTTGVDVPEIVNLVFLRRVRSRILYEQMLGRATRLRPALYGPGDDKTVFRVFDAVDLYTALRPYTEMEPVVVDPRLSFTQLADELVALEDPAQRATVHEQIVAKLRRTVRRLEEAAGDQVEALTGVRPAELPDHLARMEPGAAAEFFAVRPELGLVLDTRAPGGGDPVFISTHDDHLRRVEHGYGDGQRPDDYLRGLEEYVRTHINEIPALQVVLQRPRELTRRQLRELALALSAEGYSEATLRTAWRDARNQDVAASIIGYVRSMALGEPLVPYEDRVRAAVRRIRERGGWTYPQMQWLDKIAQQMIRDVVVDREAIDSVPVFADAGGFRRIDRTFEGRLDEVLGDIHEEVWPRSA